MAKNLALQRFHPVDLVDRYKWIPLLRKRMGRSAAQEGDYW